MEITKDLLNDLKKSGVYTVILTLLLLWPGTEGISSGVLLLALPFFVVLYFVVFAIGRESILSAIQSWIRKRAIHAFLFPAGMLILYTIYLLINGQNPLEGNPWLLVYIIFFPVLAFTLRRETSQKIGWFDFTIFVLTLLPSAFFSVKQSSEIPFTGGGFDSFSHIMILLTGVYAFAVVRGVKEVGFFPEFKFNSLITAIWVWLAFYASVFAIGYSVDFIQFIGYDKTFDVLFKSILLTMIGTFLHTALFEELFFRGILQNMLARRIGQAKSWKIFWTIGFVFLFCCAILVGYTLEGKMKWFPALVTVLIFAAAYVIENSRKFEMGLYTSLALTGVTFGLVHYHAKSIIYIGFACIAGWAYGYTYIKTKNVFYSALVHMLVNTSVLIFGLKMMR
ncbi:MAG: CPBP family intramembrane metalloprotease [Prolixibacteraceae bacterium]|nr:CPBP family intramembrane metalloprotease [Prolixibacteraceae bacterium]